MENIDTQKKLNVDVGPCVICSSVQQSWPDETGIYRFTFRPKAVVGLCSPVV